MQNTAVRTTLNRRLFPQIREGLRPGGVLIFETLLEPAPVAGSVAWTIF
jgi:hypothetical protein